MKKAPMTNELRKQVYRRDGYRCALCDSTRGLHCHHVVKRSQGGPNEEWNLITLCSICHSTIHGQRPVWMGMTVEELRNVQELEQAAIEYLSDLYIESNRLWTPYGLFDLDGVTDTTLAAIIRAQNGDISWSFMKD